MVPKIYRDLSALVRLNPTRHCHSKRHWRHLYFVVTVHGAIADSFMKKVLELTLTQDCILQTTGVMMTKEGHENGTRARPRAEY